MGIAQHLQQVYLCAVKQPLVFRHFNGMGYYKKKSP
jgi:hypothetical protein